MSGVDPNGKYYIYSIDEKNFDDYEEMGTKSKFWYTDPSDGSQYLFKSTHTEDKKGNLIIRHGEDWAEKVANEIAETLGIPHAKYDLALFKGEMGTRSKNFSTEGDFLIFGDALLEKIANKLDLEDREEQKSQEIVRVSLVMDRIIENPPKGWVSTDHIKTAFDVFLGYLMFDCLISNQDRHNENWALIIDKNGGGSLAPSFDHAASLGRNESDHKRLLKLDSKDNNQSIDQYVKRSRSHFYYKGERLKTIDAFIKSSALSISAAIEWIERLDKLTDDRIDSILSSIPDNIMSDVSKKFSTAIIKANKARIIEHKKILLIAQAQRE